MENGRDPFLKERLFGLNGHEGNHAEDVKEYYFYLDSTPTHSYMKCLYKYPQAEFPYELLVRENQRRGKEDPEYELIDTGVFAEDRYFDVFVEYAKASVEDILIRITAWNRGPEAAELHLLPTLWFRNTWSWGHDNRRPVLSATGAPAGIAVIQLRHDYYHTRWLLCEGSPELLFTENETNAQRLYSAENQAPYVKDGINDYVVHGIDKEVNNIGVFDRSKPLPTGGHIEQSDGTSWMGMYCLNMLAIAMELARENPAYEDVASKFFEHFVYIAHAMNDRGGAGIPLWDEEDGFYYDLLYLPDGSHHFLKVRSMVGLIPLFAVTTLEPEAVDCLPGFERRMQWFIDNNPDVPHHIEMTVHSPLGVRRLLSLVNCKRLGRVLKIMLDEAEFLSPCGIRSLSRFHRDRPYVLRVNGQGHRVDYEPTESQTGMFGSNSNWRGPVWFPLNFLLIESLQRFHQYLGNDFKVECPTGSGQMMTLWEVATELSRRLTRIFLRDRNGRRPVYGGTEKFQNDPYWHDLVLFYEYFHADDGIGLGASHQTGWTALVAKLIQQSGG